MSVQKRGTSWKTTTTPSTTRTAARKSAQPVVASDVEKEYILNLQHQIYFLELENRFLRGERGMGSPSAKKEEPKAESEPSTLYQKRSRNEIKQLQVDLERALIEKEELSAAKHKLEMLLEHSRSEVGQLRMEINALKNEHAKEKETLVSELMLHKKHLEDMEHSLKLAEQQLQQSIRDRQVHREEVNAMTLELKKVKDELQLATQAEKMAASKFEKYTREYSEMKTKYEMNREEMVKLEEENKRRSMEVQKYETEKWALAAKVKQLEKQLQHTIQLKESVEEQNQQLLVDIERLQKELREEQRYNENHQANENRWKAEKLGLKQKAKIFDERLASLHEELELRKQALFAVETELSHAKQEIQHLTEERDRIQEEHKRCNEIDEENVKLRTDNYLLADQVQEMERQLQLTEQKMNQLWEENATIKAQSNEWKEKLKGLAFLREALNTSDSYNGKPATPRSPYSQSVMDEI